MLSRRLSRLVRIEIPPWEDSALAPGWRIALTSVLRRVNTARRGWIHNAVMVGTGQPFLVWERRTFRCCASHFVVICRGSFQPKEPHPAMTPDPTIIIPMRPTRATLKPLIAGGKPRHEMPRSPGMLRAIIRDRLDHLQKLHPDSWEFIRGMQRVAEMENELHALDQAAIASCAKGAAQ